MGIGDRWPDERRAEPGETVCYGKIPSEREFVRIGIDSADALWMVNLLTEAHALAVESNGEIPSGREVRLVVCDPASTTVLAALLRGSRDAVGRRYPLGVFCCLDRSDLEGRLYLSPLWLGDLWQVFGATMSSAGAQGSVELANSIESAEVDLLDVEEASCRHGMTLEMPSTDPLSLVFGTGLGREAALQRFQCGVRQIFEVAGDAKLSFDGSSPPEGVCGAAKTAVLWHMLCRAAPNERATWWAVAEAWGGADGLDWQRAEFFGRDIQPSDLVDLLLGPASAGVEESQVVTLPAEPCAVAAVEDWCRSLSPPRGSCLRDLLYDATAGES